MNISYVSSASSPSGYGAAARSDIASLFVAGVNVTCESIQQTIEHTNYGLEGDIVEHLQNRNLPYNIRIIHLTPDLIPIYKEPGMYTISRLAWETNKVPQEWVEPLNSCDEIWITAPSLKTVLRDSGVTTQCTVIPEAIATQPASESITPLTLSQPKDFIFYTIAQWIERKNFQGLIKSYWKEFTGEEKVTLLLKTYRMNYSDGELKLIKRDIETWRQETPLKHYPKIFLARQLLNNEQIQKLHMLGDCYVNPSTGEGWCRPLEEAMLYAKPCISGNHGGITDLLSRNEYFQVPSHTEQATVNPSIPWYDASMKWFMLDEKKLGERMRYVFENYKISKQYGVRAQKYVLNNLSYQTVGSIMLKRLEEIHQTL